MKNLILIAVLALVSQNLNAQFDCGGVKATVLNQVGSTVQVQVEVSHRHQINPPGALYAFFTLENGSCEGCLPVGGANNPNSRVWTINLQSGTTKLIPHPDRASNCDGQELNLDLPSEYNCWVFTLTKVSANASEIVVEAEVASTYTPIVVAPGGLYETIALNNGDCISCSNLQGNGSNFPSKATWTIANQAGPTSLVFTGKAGGCANKVFQLD